jgi:GAF domain-containing protein
MAWFRRLTVAPTFEDEAQMRRARLLNIVLNSMLVMTIFGTLVMMLVEPAEAFFNLVMGIVLVALIFVMRRWMHRGRLQFTGTVLTLILWLVFTLIAALETGSDYAIMMGYALVIIVAGLLLSGNAAIAFGLLCGASALAILILGPAGDPVNIATVLITLGLSSVLLKFAVESIEEGFTRAQASAESLAQSNRALEVARLQLEDRVAERTQELTRRARYLEATTQVAREVASELDLREVLSRIVRLISEQFNFYHVGLFLLDPAGQWAVLQAASSEGGQRMLARGHRLGVGQTGTVGYVTRHGEPRIAFDVGADAVFFDNPDLPETRSVMTLPLRARGEIIGALDMQSAEQRAFTEEDATVLQSLADLVAMAIDNAQLFDRLQQSVQSEMRAYGEMTREAWSQTALVQANRGYRSDVDGTRAVTYAPSPDEAASGARSRVPLSPEMLEARRTGRVVYAQDSVAVPVKLRETVLGVLRFRKPEGAGAWTEEQVAVVEKLSDEIGIALENARLYQNSQNLAQRQQMISRVTSRIRESLDMETVLQTAVQEIRDVLGLRDIMVHLGEQSAEVVSQPAEED